MGNEKEGITHAPLDLSLLLPLGREGRNPDTADLRPYSLVRAAVWSRLSITERIDGEIGQIGD